MNEHNLIPAKYIDHEMKLLQHSIVSGDTTKLSRRNNVYVTSLIKKWAQGPRIPLMRGQVNDVAHLVTSELVAQPELNVFNKQECSRAVYSLSTSSFRTCPEISHGKRL